MCKNHLKDKLVWMLDPVGGFSVKILRTILGERRLSSRSREGVGSDVHTKWVKMVPPKVNVFFWKANLGRLTCRALLDKYGIDLDSVLCPRCNQEVESIHHALFSCVKVKSIWALVGRWWKLDMGSTTSLGDLVTLATRCGSSSKGSALWEATIRCMAYMIWSDRNKIIFHHSSEDLCDNLVIFQRRIFEWISQRYKDLHKDWKIWLSDPMSS